VQTIQRLEEDGRRARALDDSELENRLHQKESLLEANFKQMKRQWLLKQQEVGPWLHGIISSVRPLSGWLQEANAARIEQEKQLRAQLEAELSQNRSDHTDEALRKEMERLRNEEERARKEMERLRNEEERARKEVERLGSENERLRRQEEALRKELEGASREFEAERQKLEARLRKEAQESADRAARERAKELERTAREEAEKAMREEQAAQRSALERELRVGAHRPHT
jgi:hypothetical protein